MRTLYLILWLTPIVGIAQRNVNDYKYFYPVGEDPNISYMSGYVDKETILFEANPTVRYSLFNDFYKGLTNHEQYTRAYYVAVRPQLRMYVENSLPVKMMSQRVLLGTQQLFRTVYREEKHTAQFLAISLESGHYSNGQSRSALSDDFPDGSPQSDSLYQLITADTKLTEIINRNGGNFSTNMTELIVQYKWTTLDDHDKPHRWHSAQLGITHWHDRFLYIADFGGYTDEDIKLYGKLRYLFGYEYMHVFRHGEGIRISMAANSEIIQGAHPSVTPFRGEVSFSVYPFTGTNELGFFASLIYGHDNYNLRFVDTGTCVAIGLKWNQWTPFTVVNPDRD